MIRRPPRSTLSSSSAASDVYKRQDFDPGFPHSRNGFDYPALPVVDGVAITHSPLDALSVPIVDVPLILQNMQQELETYLFKPFNYTSDSKWRAVLNSSFSAFSPRAPEQFYEVYLPTCLLYTSPSPRDS
eukprot:TRINITY_DN52779_c0_g1_i1.p2 TRINITY_DN52779_c0_g1~~TRINITY_DN52779_c0_g1_i1.p2  ORF type:complete len:130 (+),score=32.81 TRINITY_DN52779_c0_g1_i1:140-529(+)